MPVLFPDELAPLVEDAVRCAFDKRYRGTEMAYERARDLVLLERSVVEVLVYELRCAVESDPG